MSAIIDANLTTLIAGVLLFGFGSGPIRGFATTLSLGLRHLDVQLDHLHPHAARRLGALAAADRTRDLRRPHAVEARSPVHLQDEVRLPRQAQGRADPVDPDQRRCADRRLHGRPQLRHRLQGRHRHPGARQAGRGQPGGAALDGRRARRRRGRAAGVRRSQHRADPRPAPGRRRAMRGRRPEGHAEARRSWLAGQAGRGRHRRRRVHLARRARLRWPGAMR